MTDVVDLLIIGSGISGLSAALEAKKYFKNVLIIDKGYHSGGRICSKKINSFCFNLVLLTLIKVVKALI